jgi:hypothetical protein
VTVSIGLVSRTRLAKRYPSASNDRGSAEAVAVSGREPERSAGADRRVGIILLRHRPAVLPGGRVRPGTRRGRYRARRGRPGWGSPPGDVSAGDGLPPVQDFYGLGPRAPAKHSNDLWIVQPDMYLAPAGRSHALAVPVAGRHRCARAWLSYNARQAVGRLAAGDNAASVRLDMTALTAAVAPRTRPRLERVQRGGRTLSRPYYRAG